jgi:hypothetical protein
MKIRMQAVYEPGDPMTPVTIVLPSGEKIVFTPTAAQHDASVEAFVKKGK